MAIGINELARTLRELLERLDTADLPLDARCNFKLSVYGCDDRDELRDWAKFMREPKTDRNEGTHWLKEYSDGLEITVFYTPGLLAATKLIEAETEVDSAEGLAKLLDEPVAVS